MDLIVRLWSGLASRLRIAIWKARGVEIRGHVRLAEIEIPRPRAVVLHQGVALDRGVTLLATNDAAHIVIGPRTYINRQTMIDAESSLEIGEDTMIGPFCYLTDHDHTFGADLTPAGGPLNAKATKLEARCWIGAHVTILKGVTIGAGTVVGAGSVVTKSLPPSVVAVGNPARVLRSIA